MSEETDREAEQVAAVVSWRRREALEAGMSIDGADTYAESEIPASDLRHLVELECPERLLEEILL